LDPRPLSGAFWLLEEDCGASFRFLFPGIPAESAGFILGGILSLHNLCSCGEVVEYDANFFEVEDDSAGLHRLSQMNWAII
jgi:hypothetical protein